MTKINVNPKLDLVFERTTSSALWAFKKAGVKPTNNW